MGAGVAIVVATGGVGDQSGVIVESEDSGGRSEHSQLFRDALEKKADAWRVRVRGKGWVNEHALEAGLGRIVTSVTWERRCFARQVRFHHVDKH